MKKLKHKYLIEVLDIFVVGNRVIIFMEVSLTCQALNTFERFF